MQTLKFKLAKLGTHLVFQVEGTKLYFCISRMTRLLDIDNQTESFDLEVSRSKVDGFACVEIEHVEKCVYVNRRCVFKRTGDTLKRMFPTNVTLWVNPLNCVVNTEETGCSRTYKLLD